MLILEQHCEDYLKGLDFSKLMILRASTVKTISIKKEQHTVNIQHFYTTYKCPCS